VKKSIGAILIAVALSSLVLSGCARKTASPPAVETPAPLSTTFTGKSPDGKLEARVIVSGKVAMVEMVTTDWTWNPTYAKADPGTDVRNAPGEGHAILALHGRDPLYVGIMRNSLIDLTPGRHTLKAKLVNNDNTPIGTEATVEFEVK